MDSINFISSCVNFSNYKSFNILKAGCKFFIFRFKSFTMSTPRSIEFKKNIIIGVSNNLIEIFTYDYLYWSVIWEGDFLRFKEFGKFLLFPVIDESCDF